MVQTINHPQNSPERLSYYTIIASWPLWLLGGLYISGPLLGWLLAAQAIYFYFCAPALPMEKQLKAPKAIIQLWLAAMAFMLFIVIMGHINFDLGLAKTIKSSAGWAKGWMLIALFIFAGAVLPIRAEIIYRAICKCGKYSVLLLPIFLLAPYIGLPQILWVSPLKILGGSGPEYFSAILYTAEPGTGLPRWQFFAPWSPAAGMIGLIYFLCAMQEKDRHWRAWGVAGALAFILLSQSRLAWLGLVIIGPLPFLLRQITWPAIWFLAFPLILACGWFAIDLLEIFSYAQSEFANARADSTRVRAILARIAWDRWQIEAFWLGHGIVEPGPHLVEYMPIGSHHSWYGLLFVKGILGLCALAVPMAASAILLFKNALANASSQMGFALLSLLILYSFGENLESLAYLYWPALILLGKALQGR